ncbi:hemerythrin domain-containing protein [Sulfobacillus harzensis]|uniref:Hemerythrin domain-containing protein n=1 Tax=Sulfobacillus harzensis TaxID=2729629 RepID=A0A7Y0Q3C6_9FIRM|nr:hemerythrin domain-containing protein [Sulfobacillus harzensis]
MAALQQKEGHQKIHEAALTDLEDMMAILRRALKRDPAAARPIAVEVVDYLDQKINAHAAVEEADLYPVIMAQKKELAPVLQALKRDHQLLAIWLDEARGSLDYHRGVDGHVMARLEAYLLLLARHFQDEESALVRAFSMSEDASRAKGEVANGTT